MRWEEVACASATTSNFNGKPEGTTLTIGGVSKAITFTKPTGVTGVTYSAEWSTTLQPGSWTTLPDTYPPEDGYTFTVPIGANTNMFMRLKVTNL